MAYRKGDWVEIPKDMSRLTERQKKNLHKKQTAHLDVSYVNTDRVYQEGGSEQYLNILNKGIYRAESELERIRKALLLPQVRGLKG